MAGATLSEFHARAARLSALANTVTTPEDEEDGHAESGSRASENARQEFDDAGSASVDNAYRTNAEAFDAGADIWTMLSVIQRD